MRMTFVGYLGAIVFTVMCSSSAVAQAPLKPWELRKTTMSNTCHVQTTDSEPKIGELLLSRHDTRKEACERAKDLYDSTLSDSTKCFVYTPGAKAGCLVDGVNLP
jgi:hypothetical protein